MFCSNCGKTMPEGADKCGFCGCPVGDSVFGNGDNTSAQMRIHPRQYKRIHSARTMGKPAPSHEYHVAVTAPDSNSPDARTTFVQDDVSSNASVLDAQRAMKAAVRDPLGEKTASAENAEPKSGTRVSAENLSEAARSSLEELDRELVIEDVDMSQFTVEPVEATLPERTPDEVESLIRELENMPGARASEPVYGDHSEEGVEEDDEEAQTDEDEALETVEEVEEEDVDDIEDSLVDDEDEEEEPKPRKRRKKPAKRTHRRKQRREEDLDEYTTEEDTGRRSNHQSDDFDEADPFEDAEEEEEAGDASTGKKVGKALLAVVLIAAVVFGGVKWIGHIRTAQNSPVLQGVDETLYHKGIEVITAHTNTEHVQTVAAAYTGEGGSLDALMAALNTSAEEVNALMPDSPSSTDTLFVQALQKIETNIANCITADAIAEAQGDADAKAKSGKSWTIVNNGIAMLKAAVSEDDLTKIINDQVVDVSTINATATPRPAVNYNTLSKGDATPAVWDLQNRLYALGYLLDDRDGTYGSKTQTAVKMFQQAVGLPTTGVADETTLNAIYADDAPRTSYAQSEDVITASLTTSTPVPATPVPETTAAPTTQEQADLNGNAVEPAA